MSYQLLDCFGDADSWHHYPYSWENTPGRAEPRKAATSCYSDWLLQMVQRASLALGEMIVLAIIRAWVFALPQDCYRSTSCYHKVGLLHFTYAWRKRMPVDENPHLLALYNFVSFFDPILQVLRWKICFGSQSVTYTTELWLWKIFTAIFKGDIKRMVNSILKKKDPN